MSDKKITPSNPDTVPAPATESSADSPETSRKTPRGRLALRRRAMRINLRRR
ncbi:MAG TPA: hypothetical protein VMI11_01430 [Actinomycetes bacterium]|nr:hypothetical protein [Actinomycetes bacterium]